MLYPILLQKPKVEMFYTKILNHFRQKWVKPFSLLIDFDQIDCFKERSQMYGLELLAESSIVAKERLAELRDECDQLLAIFTVISKKAKANAS